MIPWKQHHARRYSRDAVAQHHHWLWAWVANCYRLRGFDDDRCIREGCQAVTGLIALKLEVARSDGGLIDDRKLGPRPITTAGVPSVFRARAALRSIQAASKKIPPGQGGG